MENFARVIYFNKVTSERIATLANVIPFVWILTALAEPDVLLYLLPVPFLLSLNIQCPTVPTEITRSTSFRSYVVCAQTSQGR
jgi:hypothetical protein